MESDGTEWETCVVDKDYEICLNYPHQLRKKSNGYIVKEHEEPGKESGYIQLKLNSKSFRKHRLIALQFIPNPENLPEIDHKNGIRSDYHISNLRWVTRSENLLNRKSNRGFEYEYFDNLPVPCRPFLFYKGYEFEGYSIDDDKNIYLWNGVMFRKLRRVGPNERFPFYYLSDIYGKFISVCVNQIDDYL
jgi:hypothetical protein